MLKVWMVQFFILAALLFFFLNDQELGFQLSTLSRKERFHSCVHYYYVRWTSQLKGLLCRRLPSDTLNTANAGWRPPSLSN